MVDTQQVAYAAAMYTCMRTLGMCSGVAVGRTVFQNELRKQFDDLRLPTGVAHDAEKFVAVLKPSPETSRNYQRYILAYAELIKVVFVVPAALTGLAAFLNLLIKEHTLDKVLSSEHKSSERKHLGMPEITCAKSR